MPNDDESGHKTTTTTTTTTSSSSAAVAVTGESVQMRMAAFEQRSAMKDEPTRKQPQQHGDDNVKTVSRNSLSRDDDIPLAANTQVCHYIRMNNWPLSLCF